MHECICFTAFFKCFLLGATHHNENAREETEKLYTIYLRHTADQNNPWHTLLCPKRKRKSGFHIAHETTRLSISVSSLPLLFLLLLLLQFLKVFLCYFNDVCGIFFRCKVAGGNGGWAGVKWGAGGGAGQVLPQVFIHSFTL